MSSAQFGHEGAPLLPEVIIVSPFFPPSTLVGVHRARYLAKWLPKAGWTPIIICVDERHHEQRLDPDLAGLVPRDVEIIKVGAIPARLTRAVGLGDISIRSWSSLRSAIISRARIGNVRAVLITGAPFYPMTLADRITRECGVPVVLDFQDPWASAWGARQPLLSKAGLSYALASRLEPGALKAAAHITAVSARQCVDLVSRYPWLDPNDLTDIPIGADPEDFEELRRRMGTMTGNATAGAGFTFAYVGTVWPLLQPTLRTLLLAVAQVRDRAPALFSRLRLQFIGTSGSPSNSSTFLVKPLADEIGVGHAIEEIPQRVPFLDALSITSNADANLLIGSDEPHYTASKAFGLLMAARPYIAILHEESSALALCRAAGGGVSLGFRSRENLAAMVPQLADAIERVVAAPQGCGPVNKRAYASGEASAIAARFGAIFDRVSQSN